MERISWELLKSLANERSLTLKRLTFSGPRWLSPLFAVASLPAVWRLARSADVVHIGDPMLALAGYTVVRWLHRPCLVTVHGLDLTYPNPLYQWYVRTFLKPLTHYVAISRPVADRLRQIFPHARVTVIYPQFAQDFYDATIPRLALDHLIKLSTGNRVVLLTVGRLVRRKGHAWFARQVLPKLPKDFLYVIAGSGPQQATIKRAAADGGVRDRVVLLGRVSTRALKVLYNTADAFIQPNIPIPGDFEGYGLVLIEALLCNLPVFAARLEGIPDALHDGERGALVPPASARGWMDALTQWVTLNKPRAATRSRVLAERAHPVAAYVHLLRELSETYRGNAYTATD